MKRRGHSREFKLEVAHQVVTGEKRPAQICREHNLANSVLDRWRKEYEQRGEAVFTENVARRGGRSKGRSSAWHQGQPQGPHASSHLPLAPTEREPPILQYNFSCSH